MIAAAVAALILASVAGWATPGTQARVATPSAQIQPFQIMVSARQLPTEHFVDYSLVF